MHEPVHAKQPNTSKPQSTMSENAPQPSIAGRAIIILATALLVITSP
jgi:hypothetical protein